MLSHPSSSWSFASHNITIAFKGSYKQHGAIADQKKNHGRHEKLNQKNLLKEKDRTNLPSYQKTKKTTLKVILKQIPQNIRLSLICFYCFYSQLSIMIWFKINLNCLCKQFKLHQRSMWSYGILNPVKGGACLNMWVCVVEKVVDMATYLQMIKLDVLPNKSYGFRLLHLPSISAQKFGKRFRYYHNRWSRFSHFNCRFSFHLHSFSLWLLCNGNIEWLLKLNN